MEAEMPDTACDYDLFVIGGGSGGVRAARIAAQAGARVGLAEEYRMGGTCVVRGCVPKKLMVYASRYGSDIGSAAGYGWHTGPVSYDHAHFMSALHEEVDRLTGIYDRNLRTAGVDIFGERAVFDGSGHLLLKSSGRQVRARKYLIATGGTPWLPSESELPGVSHAIDSNGVFDMKDVPRRILIVGAGYIAVEFAHVFAGLGSQVTLVARGERVLRGFDEDVRLAVQQGLRDSSVDVRVCARVNRIDRHADALEATLSDGERVFADCVLMATGRRPNTAGLGCEEAGINLGPDGEIIVDEWSRTSAASVWAIGDVTNRVNLTPVAIREGHAFADTEFGNKPWKMDYENIPTAVFSQPEVGTVGLIEEDARRMFGEIDIYKTDFRPMKNIISGSPARTFMKIVVRSADQRVVGVHVVGDDAAEMIQMAAIAVRMGATKEDFDQTCALHPSAAEELVTMRTRWAPPPV